MPPELRHLTVTPPLATDAATSLILGGVVSYLSGTPADAWLPAWSVQVPLTVPVVVSGPAYRTGALQAAMPDVASVPAKLIETGWLYQPAAVGLRPGVAVTLGGVASYLTAKEAEALTLPALSRQVPVAAPDVPSGPE